MITISPAGPADLAAIMELERTGFDTGEQWSETGWRDELTGDGRTVLVAADDDQRLLGVITLRTTGEVADLHRIVVADDQRRQGIGGRLLEAGLAAVRALGVRSVLAEVRFDNEAAIELYQRNGFEQLGARTDYYGPGRHALILKRYDLDLEPGAAT
ncbi:GNAT family N-acetyltransferase [Microlunatus parietis]|uniref:Ribosomal-protein-alanine N-acetyltransferase n=1 Tax=Microlunatus parietis TaxID=682979 RepID=A0A7Y9LAT7_9ACTN|nr:GNAT family N-acetyltransferase [Microlunatus parietis]NYE71027.1 ribosomal-protein-alanine N-acetyltransferase [Microlunatus parietis]